MKTSNYDNEKSKKLGKTIALTFHTGCVAALFAIVFNNPSIINVALLSFRILWFVIY